MKNEIKTGAILGYVNMAASLLVSLLYTPILLSNLGQSEYGLYALVASVIGYLSVLDMGFGNAMIRFVSRSKVKQTKSDENKINGLFLLLYLIIGIIAFIIGLILLFNISSIFKSLTPLELKKARTIMIILIFTISISFPLSIFDSYVVSSEKFKFIKILALIQTLIIPITMLPLLFLGYKAIAMVIVTSSYTIIFHLITMYYCFKKLDMKINFSFKNIDKVLLKEVLFYSLFIFLNIIVDNIYNNTDQIILGIVSGTVAVSIYSVSMKISQINMRFSTTISGLFFPKINKLLEEDDGDKKVSDIFIKVSRIQLYVMALILFGFVIFGKQFIILWVGEQYIDSYYILLLLLIPSIVPLTQNIGISILQAKNKHKFRSLIYLIIAILNVLISIPLARQYAGIGAAIGTALATIIGQIVTMNIYYWKVVKIDIPTYWRRFLKFMVPLGVVSIVLRKYISMINNNLLCLALALVFVLFYVIYAYFYTNNEERNYLKSIKKRLFKRSHV